jgi:hypothetical protein
MSEMSIFCSESTVYNVKFTGRQLRITLFQSDIFQCLEGQTLQNIEIPVLMTELIIFLWINHFFLRKAEYAHVYFKELWM